MGENTHQRGEPQKKKKKKKKINEKNEGLYILTELSTGIFQRKHSFSNSLALIWYHIRGNWLSITLIRNHLGQYIDLSTAIFELEANQ